MKQGFHRIDTCETSPNSSNGDLTNAIQLAGAARATVSGRNDAELTFRFTALAFLTPMIPFTVRP
jgi:hypothetical protein